MENTENDGLSSAVVALLSLSVNAENPANGFDLGLSSSSSFARPENPANGFDVAGKSADDCGVAVSVFLFVSHSLQSFSS